MSINELLNQNGNAKISVSIDLNELRQFHEELVQNAINKNEQVKRKNPEDELLSALDACKELGITRATLTRWDHVPMFPKYKIGRKVFYKRTDIKEFISQSKIARE